MKCVLYVVKVLEQSLRPVDSEALKTPKSCARCRKKSVEAVLSLNKTDARLRCVGNFKYYKLKSFLCASPEVMAYAGAPPPLRAFDITH